MKPMQRVRFLGASGVLCSLVWLSMAAAGWAQQAVLRLSPGFSPNPMVVRGTGGGDRPAAEVVNTRQTVTGPCLGYVSQAPHQRITLEAAFTDLELTVDSEQDTTLIVRGPGGIWCTDDSNGKNPAIAGEWLAGDYQVWVGAYQVGVAPDYHLSVRDRS